MVRVDKFKALKDKMSRLGVREEDIEEKFIRAQGPGGQRVNKVSTCVYLRHIPTGIEVRCQKERFQAQNRFFARRLLLEKIESFILGKLSAQRQRIEKIRRQKRKRSRRAKLKMLETKRRQSEKKAFRARVREADFFSFIFLAIAALGYFSLAYADDASRIEVYLKNQDRLSGTLIEEDKERVVLEHEILGRLEISRQSIEKITAATEEASQEKKEKIWTKEISAGYAKTSGNTKSSSASLDLRLNRKTQGNEFTLRANGYYASSDGKMDAQRYLGMLRYAFSFGRELKWYNFYKFEADHDRFANIDYRLVPSLGYGFWFSDTAEWKAMLELGAGFEHVVYRDNTKDRNEAVLIPRVFFEKSFLGQSKLSQDASFFLPAEDPGEYRIHSETALSNPLNDRLSLKFSLVNDYDAAAAEGIKEHDMRFISALKYAF